MKDIKNQYIGARFTEEEKKEIQEFVDSMNTNLSDLIREAIFFHINFIKQNKGNLEKLEIYVIKEV